MVKEVFDGMNTIVAVPILGMHRSGTSALAGSLQEAGLYLGTVHEANPHNQKGNRENAEIVALNEDILAFNDGHWTTPPVKIKWTQNHASTRDKIIESFIAGQSIWGFKDPRTVFTLDFWLDGLRDAEVKMVGSFRHPFPVATSLQKRDQFPYQLGYKIWETYNLRILELQRQYGFPLVSFDVSPDSYLQRMKQISAYLFGKPVSFSKENSFFDAALRHETDTYPVTTPSSTRLLYAKLICIYEEQLQ